MNLILGIDPGSRVTGYGLIEQNKQQLRYVDSGCIRTGEGTLSQRLLKIFNGVCFLLETYEPKEVAIEQVFVHQNPSSALKLGHARGVAMLAAASHQREVMEYSAREVKQAVVGNGAAKKEQVKLMVMHLLMLKQAPQVDAADALAIAMCHAYRANKLNVLPKQTMRRQWRHYLVDKIAEKLTEK